MSNLYETILDIASKARQAAETVCHPTLGTLRKPPQRRQLGKPAAALVVNPDSLIVADWQRQLRQAGGLA